VLVNNAGVFQFDPVEEITEKEFHREFDTKVLGTILATQQALKHFPRTGGSIINLSSIASQNPVPNSSLYSATKGAIEHADAGAREGVGTAEYPGQHGRPWSDRHRRQP
jgi:3-oxoacyl-[acyl-carrier protein] reductase